MKDLTNGKLEETLEFAKTIKDDSLEYCIERLKLTDENCETETNLMNDFAPKSFYFERLRKDGSFAGNGGVIFHGTHDSGGNGAFPTFSVNVTPTNGWSIHT